MRIDLLEWSNESRRSAGRADEYRAVGPPDEGVVSGEPAHTEDRVVPLQWRCSKRRGERYRRTILLRCCESEVDLHLSSSRHDRPIGEPDGAVGRREREAASSRESSIDEFG